MRTYQYIVKGHATVIDDNHTVAGDDDLKYLCKIMR